MYYSTSNPTQNEDLLNQILGELRPSKDLDHKYPDENGDYWCSCPFHNDLGNIYFFFNRKGYKCSFCGEQGSLEKLGKELNLPGNDEKQVTEFRGVTLEDYSKKYKLPLDYLKSTLQISERKYNGSPRLSIPYMDNVGVISCTRYRISLQGPNQFFWQKGSHIIPYGLWMLEKLLHSCKGKGEHSNIILLVNDESDAQVLWFWGIPALAIPYSSLWKPEWREYFKDHSIYVLQKAGKAGQDFVDRVANNLTEIHANHLPADRKAFSDCQDNGDNIQETVKEFIEKAISYQNILNQRRIEESKQLLHAAEPILHSDILNEVIQYCEDNSLVGEEANVKLIYLAGTSRVLDRPVSEVIKGPSSGGKSYEVEIVFKLFPKSAYYILSSLSEKALIYLEEPLVHRILIIYEQPGASSEFLSYIIRSLLSEGQIRYVTVENTDNGIKPREIIKEGPTGFITTTTSINLHPENETRMLSLSIRDDSKQTQRIIGSIAEKAMGKNQIIRSAEPLVAFQMWIEKFGIHEVVIPFAKILAELTHPAGVRIRRDFTTIINLIKTVAILYQKQRQVDDSGRIIATLLDYQIVYDLVSTIINEEVEKSVSSVIRETVAVVKQLLPDDSSDDDDEDVPKKAHETVFVDLPTLAEKLHLDRSTTSRRVNKAIDLEFLINIETRKGQRARIILGRDIPENRSVLPSPDELRNKYEGLS
jgi:hypothetical protein